MKLHIALLSSLLSSLLGLCSCVEDGLVERYGELRLSADLQDDTLGEWTGYQKRNFTRLSDGDGVAVFIQDGGLLHRTVYNRDLRMASVFERGLLTFGEKLYWPGSGQEVKVYAWYPLEAVEAGAGIGSTSETFTVREDQAEDITASNLMFASAVESYTDYAHSDVVLSFRPLLSRLYISLVPGEGGPDVEGATVTLGDRSGGYLRKTVRITSLKTGSLETLPVLMGGPLKVIAGGDTSGFAVIPPQDIGGKVITVRLSDGTLLTATLARSGNGLQAGGFYKYVVKVNLTTLDLEEE